MTRFKQSTILDPIFVAQKLQEYLKEDCADQDITTATTQRLGKHIKARLIAKEQLIFAGNEIVKQSFSDCKIIDVVADGTLLKAGNFIASIEGRIQSVLSKERVVLNLIQRLSGIASTTNRLSQKTKKHNIELLDTRKTTPGLRIFEKFAVAIGGGINHRFSLKDAVMIKDNHLIGNPNIIQAVATAKAQNPNKEIQIEVDTKKQLEIALESKATSILLDNFKPNQLSNIITYIRSHHKGKKMYIELSGGITEETLESFCIAGANGISMGALTHNITSKDIGLEIE